VKSAEELADDDYAVADHVWWIVTALVFGPQAIYAVFSHEPFGSFWWFWGLAAALLCTYLIVRGSLYLVRRRMILEKAKRPKHFLDDI